MVEEEADLTLTEAAQQEETGRGEVGGGEEGDEVGDTGGQPGLLPGDPHPLAHQLHEGQELEGPGLGGGGNGVEQLGADGENPGPFSQYLAHSSVSGAEAAQQGDDRPGGGGLVVQAGDHQLAVHQHQHHLGRPAGEHRGVGDLGENRQNPVQLGENLVARLGFPFCHSNIEGFHMI